MKKLLLLHGEAISSSREKLLSLKKDFEADSIVTFEKGSEVQTIIGSLTTPSLLSDEQLIVLENPPEDFIFDLSLITYHLSLIIWFDHEVASKKPVIDWVKSKGQILYFPEVKEVSVFPFLDYLANGDSRAFLEMDKLKKGNFEIQYFITMVFYMLRSLILTPKNAPQFVKDKLKRQREKFKLDDVKKLYKEILEIDFKIKSGLMAVEQAEFALVTKFVK